MWLQLIRADVQKGQSQHLSQCCEDRKGVMPLKPWRTAWRVRDHTLTWDGLAPVAWGWGAGGVLPEGSA